MSSTVPGVTLLDDLVSCGCADLLSEDSRGTVSTCNRAQRRSLVRISKRLMARTRAGQKSGQKGSRANTPVELSVAIMPVHDVQGSHVAPDGASMQEGDDSAPLQGAAPLELGALQAQLEAALHRIDTLEGQNRHLREEMRQLRTPHEPRSGASTPELSRGSVPPPQLASGPSGRPDARESCLPRPQPQARHACCHSVGQLPTTSDYSHTPHPIYLGREEVPVFKGDTPASMPLVRNQEVEAWISTIEALARPPTDDNFIRVAKARARGYAQYLLLSPVFEFISSWTEFKAQLRMKFRGTCTSESFFEMLSQSRMIPGQTPLDYYQQVEMAVFQGVRDYPHEIGDAEGLIRRTFKAGLPERLQRQLSLHTFSSARAMAERVQCAWNDWTGLRMSLPLATQVSRHCGGQASQPVASPPSSSTFTYPPTTRPLTAESVPGLDFYSDNPFSVQATQATQTGSPGHSHNFDNERGQPGSPRQRQFQAVRPKKWCTYHRVSSHNTSECMRGQGLCYVCGEQGHFAAACPFPSRRQATTPLPAGRGNFSCEHTSRVTI